VARTTATSTPNLPLKLKEIKEGLEKFEKKNRIIRGATHECHAPLMDGAWSILPPPFASSNPDLSTHWKKTFEIIVVRERVAHAPSTPWCIGDLGHTTGLGIS